MKLSDNQLHVYATMLTTKWVTAYQMDTTVKVMESLVTRGLVERDDSEAKAGALKYTIKYRKKER